MKCSAKGAALPKEPHNFRMTDSEEELTPLSVTKEASYNTDTPDDFTADTEQKCSKNNSALVQALKKHIDSLKQQLRNKQFII